VNGLEEVFQRWRTKALMLSHIIFFRTDNAGGIADFLEAEAHIDAIKSFVRREGYPQAVLDRLSSGLSMK
jgi:hypothetical protein